MKKLIFAIICLMGIFTNNTYSQGDDVLLTLPLNQGWSWFLLNIVAQDMSVENLPRM